MALRPCSVCARLALSLLVSGAGTLAACGGPQQPTAADIYHDPALRRGAIPAEAAEAELVSRLDALPSGEPVSIGGAVYVATATYDAASGRTCRHVRRVGGSTRLACADDEAGWVFVPDVFGSENPFELPSGAETEPVP